MDNEKRQVFRFYLNKIVSFDNTNDRNIYKKRKDLVFNECENFLK